MPNGYTQPIYDGEDISLRDFILKCSRGFGFAIDLRDAPPEAVPPPVFTPDTAHHDERIKAAETRLEEVRSWTPEEAARQAAEDFKQEHARWRERVDKTYALAARYDDWINRITNEWHPPAELAEMKQTILKWLRESKKFDADPRYWEEHEPVELDGEAFRRDRINAALKEIEWGERWRFEEIKRAREKTKYATALYGSLPKD